MTAGAVQPPSAALAGEPLPVAPPTEPVALEGWLPFLKAVADRAARTAADAAEQEGRRVSCAKGCGACCRQMAPISLVEASALGRLVEALPEPRRSEIRGRFAAGLERVRASGVLEQDYTAASEAFPLAANPQQRLGAAWYSLKIACPFLEEESCSIHADRPLVCREYQVTSPAAVCARLYREPIERLEPPVRLSQALARATAKLNGVSVAMVPILMSLQLTPQIAAALSRRHDPEVAQTALLSELRAEAADPAER